MIPTVNPKFCMNCCDSNIWLITQVEDPETQKLTLRLMDDDTLEKSEYIGSCEVSLAQVCFDLVISNRYLAVLKMILEFWWLSKPLPAGTGFNY
jgi:hypothetical protein